MRYIIIFILPFVRPFPKVLYKENISKILMEVIIFS